MRIRKPALVIVLAAIALVGALAAHHDAARAGAQELVSSLETGSAQEAATHLDPAPARGPAGVLQAGSVGR